jgi:hypothetical protein
MVVKLMKTKKVENMNHCDLKGEQQNVDHVEHCDATSI